MREKSNWKITPRFEADDEEVSDMKDAYTEFHREHLRMPELEPNENERKVIETVSHALDSLAEYLEVPSFGFDISQIKFVALEDFKLQRETDTVEGFFDGVHIYMPRVENQDVGELLHTLSHEVAHAISFLNHEAIHYEGEGTDYLIKRLGFDMKTKAQQNVGAGINEIATEMLANTMRSFIIESNDIELTEEQKHNLHTIFAYGPQLRVLTEAIDMVVEDRDGERTQEGYGEFSWHFLRDFVTGENNMFKPLSNAFIKRGKKDGLKTLFQMGVSNEDAYATAVALGMDDVAKEIKQEFTD